jgi:hypothetical protein
MVISILLNNKGTKRKKLKSDEEKIFIGKKYEWKKNWKI